MLGPICSIIYYEAKIKPFKYIYYAFKTIGYGYKYFWDLYYDWGLFHRTKPGHRFLRDQMKYPAWVYYFSMIFNIFGLYSWAISLWLYTIYENKSLDQSISSVEFYNHVMWITWFECIINATRRTIWVVIRVENEFFNNFE